MEPVDLPGEEGTLKEGDSARKDGDEGEGVDISRVQLLLAEKRTSLAALRTGIAIFTLPLSVTTVLVTTSRYYNFVENLHYLIPLLVLCGLLVTVGTYLIFVALIRHRHQNEQIRKIKMKHAAWKDLVDG
jgi:uncharacterized membrane protein YidH (DUF202 family)